jgi:hypothetical protein
VEVPHDLMDEMVSHLFQSLDLGDLGMNVLVVF